MSEIPKLYRILTQTEAAMITADTTTDMTELEAKALAQKDIIAPNGNYQPFVLIPICTEFQWRYGQINFCPRCGKNICESVGGDYLEGVTDYLEFDCPECEATMFVHIISTPEEANSIDVEDRN
ncbi:hypothetical protein PC41400_14870 [Paenibacillus chitinolyticus]|uniref:Uncharacterized protein n=1 Tax=Paenibacillus chitinolyticus TaxID=79263 RepID=A0A410WXC6_9BACL|nr:hypothetical protein [Paenibacillus chitinolyticus]MCY9592375.1 hypothetical protein [Paenibacillus chitinolyticus]MCY9599836.1 hypothetical protein [Paenibacillus chitinolyticus]QAV18891.1 hypothetical protein PC41400_14870 [Paenibacillus chitinolyticus]